MRSIINKFSELSNYLSSIRHKFTCNVITESWLTPVSDLALNIDGYKSLSLYRNNKMGGGIKLYYLDFIEAIKLHDFTVCHDS